MLRSRAATVLLAAAVLVCSGIAAGGSAQPSRPYLPLAEQGLERVNQVWWNPVSRWYTTYPYKAGWGGGGLATLWDAYPAFETTALVAQADPTPANKAAAATVATGAERYWDPDVAPTGGYVFLPGLRGPRSAFFDDNGWFGLAFFDAYTATKNPRFLDDAIRAFHFIYASGWASRHGGGVWWDTEHTKKTAEPLAAEAVLGAELYRATDRILYLRVAEKLIAWANRNSWNAARHLYQRSDVSDTVMNYVQGMMIGAHAILCSTLKVHAWCTKAEQLAAASQVAFPPSYEWAPETDAIYLRYLLELYRVDRNPRWFNVAAAAAKLAAANAKDSRGLYTKRWDGGFASNDRLLTDTGTLMLFAAVSNVPAPGAN